MFITIGMKNHQRKQEYKFCITHNLVVLVKNKRKEERSNCLFFFSAEHDDFREILVIFPPVHCFSTILIFLSIADTFFISVMLFHVYKIDTAFAFCRAIKNPTARVVVISPKLFVSFLLFWKLKWFKDFKECSDCTVIFFSENQPEDFRTPSYSAVDFTERHNLYSAVLQMLYTLPFKWY